MTTLPALIRLSISNRCKNLCQICACAGKPPFKLYPPGKTEIERKGLANFFEAVGKQALSVSGRDPLRNPDALELANQFHTGTKEIVINPISFLTVGMGINAKKITSEEVQKLTSSPLPSQVQRLCKILSRFDHVTISCGTLQAPSPEIAQLAYAFFYAKIFPAIKTYAQSHNISAPNIHEKSFNGTFEQGNLIQIDPRVIVVGRFRSKNKKHQTSLIRSAQSIALKRFRCGYADSAAYYFKKDDNGISLYQSICTAAGHTPYTHFKTGITLEKMAAMSPEQIAQKLIDEGKAFKQTAAFGFLSGVALPRILDRKTHYEKQFEIFIRVVEMLIKEETGKKISIVDNTLSYIQSIDSETAHPCEACNTAGALLHQEKIPPQKLEVFLKQVQKRLVRARVRKLLDKIPDPLKR